MSASWSGTRRLGSEAYAVLAPYDGPLPIEWQILAELKSVVRLLSERIDHRDADALLNRREVAAWLGVSCRWVERHLRPTSQLRRGGRAWYLRSDVEEQMRTLRPRGEAPAPPRRRSKLAPPPAADTEVQQRIATVEARLRESVAETTRESPISSRKRGARAASGR